MSRNTPATVAADFPSQEAVASSNSNVRSSTAHSPSTRLSSGTPPAQTPALGAAAANSGSTTSAFFDRLRPNRPRTATNPHRSTPSPEYNGTAALNQAPASPSQQGQANRRSAFRSGLARHRSSSSSSQLPIVVDHAITPSNHQFTTAAHRSSHSPARNSTTHDDGVNTNNNNNHNNTPPMHSMTRTHSSGGVGVSGSGGGSGSALGRMFRRYSHGQHQQPRTASSNSTMASTADSAPTARTTSHMASPTRPSTVSASNPLQQNQGVTTNNLSTAPPSGDQTVLLPGLESLPGAIAAAGGSGLLSESSPRPSSSAVPAGTSPSPQSGVHRIRLVPHLEATRSLHFEPIERDLREGISPVKIGRFTDRVPSGGAEETRAGSGTPAPNTLATQPTGTGPGNRGGAVPSSAGGGGRIDSGRIAFKSKVVSRGHAELWCEPGGKFFIKDTKSSSGTFLNHIRLSAPSMESKPHAIKDGDILQLGVDYQGGTEEIYRCVKIRVELNRGWQREANQFNVNALRQLRALQGSPMSSPSAQQDAPAAASLPTNRQTMNVTDCCICLFSVTVCQALFIAPCSHVFHYKCIRPMLNMHHPGFSCPLCRTFADLEADVEQDEEWQEALIKEAEAEEVARSRGSASIEPSTPSVERQMSDVLQVSAQNETSPAAPAHASSIPSTPSGLRQQLSVSDQAFLAARPGTAVNDDAANAMLDSNDRTAVRAAEEEAQEIMQESPVDSHGSGSRRAYPRISEESSDIDIGSNAGSVGHALQERRGSQPINIRSSNNQRSGLPDLSGFSPLEEARTPVNQHVLSVLAEAPPPRSTGGARRLAAQQGVGAAGDETLTAAPAVGVDILPSLGSSSARLGATDRVQGGERRGSAVSEDAGFQTPAEGTSVEQPSGVVSPLQQRHQAQQLQGGSVNGSNGSRRASTAGEGENATLGIAEGVNGPSGSSSAEGSAEGRDGPSRSRWLSADASKDSKRGREGSIPSRDSSIASSSIDGGARAGSAGGAGNSSSGGGGGGGGKMKMFLKKAAGA